MKINKYAFLKIVFVTLLSVLCFIKCETDNPSSDSNNEELDISNVTIATFDDPRQFEFTQPTRVGYGDGSAENNIIYPTANICWFTEALDVLVIGNITSDPQVRSTISMSLELDRARTLEFNNEFRDSIPIQLISPYSFNLFSDMYISKSDVSINSKDDTPILINQSGDVGLTEYKYANGADTPFGDALFFELGNKTDEQNRFFIFSEQNTFTQDTIITVTEYTDFRMMTYLRFMSAQSNTSSLVGLTEDGSEVNFNLDYTTDLLELSHFFDEQEVSTFQFNASSDFEIIRFRGVIRASENPIGGDTLINF